MAEWARTLIVLFARIAAYRKVARTDPQQVTEHAVRRLGETGHAYLRGRLGRARIQTPDGRFEAAITPLLG